ncbi:hypothetical protein C3K47_12830 [Solitalea longa]|uniref:DoxX family protein n=1 Tax=Solitalea longa TaxID=2079460 RepID=A0A2S5A1D2_9SPHI|nr:hypothetical protein [Solitalea longa]POY36077.1 hypothetical protein C3K47_12830 [Solitalea longa]
MKKIPIPVIIVAVLFILTGSIGLIYHRSDFNGSNFMSREAIWIFSVRLLAVICGVLLLCRINWARWLAIAWLLFHVILSASHSTAELITHIVFLILVAVLLFLPKSSAYFQSKNSIS